ncbi:MAG: hypothetical protein DRJ03_17550 [Chloroflexi bacterium]|nr:MAG: hypothetical protein DRI81_08795 [Chloroflexota bacterium]RLC83308.1 MAG: hypothetical protein DRJ03_17550 [Chloroflexota bacterium]
MNEDAMRQHRERFLDLAVLVLLALVVAAFFWPLLFAGQWIPRGGGDLVSFLWPLYRFGARSLRAGVVPLWNPHLYSGAPFVADNQSGLFYPINLLTFALFGEPSYSVMEGLTVFHIWLAGANMFFLARGLGLRRPAALFGGIAFALSDLFLTHIGNLNLNATAAWLPLLLLLTHRALNEGRATWAAGAGAVLAIAALAGHGQILLFLALALVIYFLYRLTADWRRGWRYELRTLSLAGLIVAVGVSGAALTLLPSWEMAAHTGRGHLPYDEATRYSLSPRALIGLLSPGFYGRGVEGFWGSWERVEVGYAGVTTLVLAVLGVWPTTSKIRHQRLALGYFFVTLVPLAFALAMGRHTPLYGLLYRYAPTFDQVRAPARLILLADLSLAALAAYGLDHLLRPRRSSETSEVWIGLAALAAGALLLTVGLPQAQAVPPDRVQQASASIIAAAALLALSGLLVWLAGRFRWAACLLPLLLAADMIGLGSTLEAEPNDPTLGFLHEDVAAFVRQNGELSRIEATIGNWQPDAALVHGLYDIGGVYNPLGLAPYQAYRWAVGERGAPLYNLLSVKYVLAGKGDLPGGEQMVPVYTDNPQIDVYLNTAALPRAFLVYRSQIVADHAAAWQAIHAPEFDPAQVVILEQGEPLVADPNDGKPRVSFTRYELNEVKLAVATPANALLVLSDVYYPGWQATVDGAPAELLRADYAFRAVPVPPGEHIVRMEFAPWPWRVGLTISIVTWLGLIVWGLASLCGRRFNCLIGRTFTTGHFQRRQNQLHRDVKDRII